MRFIILAGLCLALTACTSLEATNGHLTKLSTFGTGQLSVKVDPQAQVTEIEAKSDGTNVFRILDGLWDAAKSFFGGSEPPEININVEPRELPAANTPTTITA